MIFLAIPKWHGSCFYLRVNLRGYPMKIRIALLATAFSLLASSAALAGAVDVLVGDKDGFGVGCSDTGTCATVLTNTVTDERSAAEAAATNGAQYTDVYSAVFSLFGPNPDIADIILPFSGTLTSATSDFRGRRFSDGCVWSADRQY